MCFLWLRAWGFGGVCGLLWGLVRAWGFRVWASSDYIAESVVERGFLQQPKCLPCSD